MITRRWRRSLARLRTERLGQPHLWWQVLRLHRRWPLKVPAALRVRFLRTACPACWLLGVSLLVASRMVFRAQGESPAPRS